jgi:hypothetical protein
MPGCKSAHKTKNLGVEWNEADPDSRAFEAP